MKPKCPRGLIFRLTGLYCLLFFLAFFFILFGLYQLFYRDLLHETDVDLLEDLAEIKSAYQKGGLGLMKAFIREEVLDDGPEDVFVRVWDRNGHLVFSSDSASWGEGLFPASPPPLEIQGHLFHTVSIPRRPEHKARVMVAPLQEGLLLEEAIALKWREDLLKKLRQSLILGAGATLIAALLAGLLLARQIISQIRKIDAVARKIATSNDLSQRVPLKGTEDELDSLASTFNLMLERLEAFVRELSEMIDHTAHDFKTPLARIRTMAETSLQDQNPEAVKAALVQIMDESDRFLNLLNAIMDISEAKTGLLHLRKEPLLLKDLIEEVAQPFRVLARSRKIRFQTRYRENNRVVFGDKRKILQALLNILDNAFKVTPPGGEVVLEARGDEGRVEIRISDTGPGIAPEEVPRIFERFYRRSPSGRGLGLALAKAYIEAHGGQILVSSSPGRGSLFSVYLPSPELAKETSGH